MMLAGETEDAEAGVQQHNTYETSGVSIAAQDRAIELFKRKVSATHGSEVLAGVGSFGAAFAPDLAGCSEPVFVSSTDGVGTKVVLHARFGTHAWAGRDLVAAVVNDVICAGARPLFFLDYLACNKVEPETVNQVVSGMADTCGEIGCALIGGEIAEMGAVYQPGEYDLAGFAVGLVDKPRMLGSSRVEAGDVLVGLASTGVHCNGFSLVRRVFGGLTDAQWDEPLDDLGTSLRDSLLAPTKCYASEVAGLMELDLIRAAAHVSGGGLQDNVPRMIPAGLAAEVDRQAVPVPPVFDIIRARGAIEPDEMWHVFNMGVGLVVVVPPGHVEGVLGWCRDGKCPAQVIGRVVESSATARFGWAQ
jgi:phosphoribosylformylglycinamidine cyclo-ligase